MKPFSCHAKGPKEAWSVHRDRFPVCNRPAGHEGPHRMYSLTGWSLAEWEVPIQ